MNVRNGLFRLWIVGSAVFILGVGAVSYKAIREEFRIASTDYDALAKNMAGDSLLPTDCSKARGKVGSDYSEMQNLCWYKTEDFRRLYPEYNDMSDRVLSDELYSQAGQPLKHLHPWGSVAKVAAVAFGWPLAVLALAWSLRWAFSGFRSASTPRAS